MRFGGKIWVGDPPNVLLPPKNIPPTGTIDIPSIDPHLFFAYLSRFFAFLPQLDSTDRQHRIAQLATACHVDTGSAQDRTGPSILPRCPTGPHRAICVRRLPCPSIHPAILPYYSMILFYFLLLDNTTIIYIYSYSIYGYYIICHADHSTL